MSANTQYQFGGNALHWACENGHKAIVELLIQKGIDANIQSINNN